MFSGAAEWTELVRGFGARRNSCSLIYEEAVDSAGFFGNHVRVKVAVLKMDGVDYSLDLEECSCSLFERMTS